MLTDLTNDCRKYLGLGIHNSGTNIVRGDSYFLQSLYDKYGEKEVDSEIHKLRKTEGDNTVWTDFQ